MRRGWPTCPGITPRWAGCHLHAYRITIVEYNSSPRERGKLRFASDSRIALRLIPAWAGKTRRTARTPSGSTAHPRAGGENRSAATLIRSLVGSSPRGRGKHEAWAFDAEAGRLIPARAGKTRCSSMGRMCRTAHPRAGGENLASPLTARLKFGSSPRGRGKLGPDRSLQTRVRLIPARAGKTGWPSARPGASPAHPRAGGENVRPAARGVAYDGSSPRGRGKPLGLLVQADHDRLIPARAGKTEGGRGGAEAVQAHPRAGGENRPGSARVPDDQGSSPHGRGKPGRTDLQRH